MKRKSLSFFVKITLFKKKKEKKGKNTNINNNKNAQDQRKRRHHRIKRWFFIFWYGDMMIPLSCPLSSFYKYIYIYYIYSIYFYFFVFFSKMWMSAISLVKGKPPSEGGSSLLSNQIMGKDSEKLLWNLIGWVFSLKPEETSYRALDSSGRERFL